MYSHTWLLFLISVFPVWPAFSVWPLEFSEFHGTSWAMVGPAECVTLCTDMCPDFITFLVKCWCIEEGAAKTKWINNVLNILPNIRTGERSRYRKSCLSELIHTGGAILSEQIQISPLTSPKDWLIPLCERGSGGKGVLPNL
jgi:hypothetical protein